MADYFKVVYIKTTQEVEPVPHQWEENGTVYWPPTKGQVRQQQSNAGSLPDKKTWKRYDCSVKASNILLYMHASAQADQLCADSSSDSTTDDETGKTFNKRTSLKKNTCALPAYDFNFIKQTGQKTVETLTGSSSDAGTTVDDENTLVDNSEVLEKISTLESKVDQMSRDLTECRESIVEKIVERFADISVRLNNIESLLKKTESSFIITQDELEIFPIKTVPALENLEKGLVDKSYKKKVFTYLTRCIGSALPHKSACYRLADIMFSKDLLVKYSWTGMSRSLEKKAFNKLTQILDVFYNVVVKSDNSFTFLGRDSFFRDCILKHSNTRLKFKKCKAITETIAVEGRENLNVVIENQAEPEDNEETNDLLNHIDVSYEVFNVEEHGLLSKTNQS